MIKLRDILKKEKLNEDKSLAYFIHIGYDIFDSIHKLDNEMKKHSVAKKSGKIKKINIPQVSDFNGDMEKYMDALNKHMKEVEKLAKKQKKDKKK